MPSLTDTGKENTNGVELVQLQAPDGTDIGNDGDALKTTATVNVPSDGLKVINEFHQRIHDGDAYIISDFDTLGNGGEKELVLSTGAKKVHLNVIIFAEKAAIYKLFEDPTYTSTSNPVNGINRNRTSANTSTLTIKSFSGKLTSGTKLIHEEISGGSVGQGNNSSAINRDTNEFILKTNSLYSLKIESLSINNKVNWMLNWYELT